MVTPIVGFIVTGMASGWVILKYNIAFSRAEKNLERVLRGEGKEWKFGADFAFRRALFKEPKSILLISDSERVAAAKNSLINQRMLLAGTMKKAIVTAMVGLLLTAFISLCELALQG